jgi:hypothetical protein
VFDFNTHLDFGSGNQAMLSKRESILLHSEAKNNLGVTSLAGSKRNSIFERSESHINPSLTNVKSNWR